MFYILYCLFLNKSQYYKKIFFIHNGKHLKYFSTLKFASLQEVVFLFSVQYHLFFS